MAYSLTDKAVALFERETDYQAKKEAFEAIRDLVTADALKFQAELQDMAAEIQDFIEKINPNKQKPQP